MDNFCKNTFRIIGTTPQDIPLGRLGLYMQELASFMGHEDKLRFDQIEVGSIGIAVNSPEKYHGAIVSRMLEAASGKPEAAAFGSWKKINEYLEKDGWLAEIPLSDGQKISFPGKIEPFYPPLRSLIQKTSIQGRLVRIEGGGDTVKVGLEIDGDLKLKSITLNAAIAAQLAGYFHKDVRLDGEGKWGRNGEGKWYLESLNVKSFEVLQDFSLKKTLKQLSHIIPQEGGRFLVDSLEEMRQI